MERAKNNSSRRVGLGDLGKSRYKREEAPPTLHFTNRTWPSGTPKRSRLWLLKLAAWLWFYSSIVYKFTLQNETVQYLELILVALPRRIGCDNRFEFHSLSWSVTHLMHVEFGVETYFSWDSHGEFQSVVEVYWSRLLLICVVLVKRMQEG